MKMNLIEKMVPGHKPDVEWKVIETNGIGSDVVDWLEENWGPAWGRWFIINRIIYIREDKDYTWFMLKWMS
jgi:hypothetical protein